MEGLSNKLPAPTLLTNATGPISTKTDQAMSTDYEIDQHKGTGNSPALSKKEESIFPSNTINGKKDPKNNISNNQRKNKNYSGRRQGAGTRRDQSGVQEVLALFSGDLSDHCQPDPNRPEYIKITPIQGQSFHPSKVDSYLLYKALTSACGNLDHRNHFIHEGDSLVIRAPNITYKNKLKEVKELSGVQIQPPTPHKSFNGVKGIIGAKYLQNRNIDLIKEAFTYASVTEVIRLGENSDRYLLHFNRDTLPLSIHYGGLIFAIQPYIRMPQRCKNCHRYGHSAKKCKNQEKLCNHCCYEIFKHRPLDKNSQQRAINEHCQYGIFCINCNSISHGIAARSCPSWSREKEILSLVDAEKISFQVARTLVSTNSRNVETYASIASFPPINNKHSEVPSKLAPSLPKINKPTSIKTKQVNHSRNKFELDVHHSKNISYYPRDDISGNVATSSALVHSQSAVQVGLEKITSSKNSSPSMLSVNKSSIVPTGNRFSPLKYLPLDLEPSAASPASIKNVSTPSNNRKRHRASCSTEKLSPHPRSPEASKRSKGEIPVLSSPIISLPIMGDAQGDGKENTPLSTVATNSILEKISEIRCLQSHSASSLGVSVPPSPVEAGCEKQMFPVSSSQEEDSITLASCLANSDPDDFDISPPGKWSTQRLPEHGSPELPVIPLSLSGSDSQSVVRPEASSHCLPLLDTSISSRQLATDNLSLTTTLSPTSVKSSLPSFATVTASVRGSIDPLYPCGTEFKPPLPVRPNFNRTKSLASYDFDHVHSDLSFNSEDSFSFQGHPIEVVSTASPPTDLSRRSISTAILAWRPSMP
jgi:hypothetical protein